MSDVEGVTRRLRRANEELRAILDRLEPMASAPGHEQQEQERRELQMRAWELVDEIEQLLKQPGRGRQPGSAGEDPRGT